MTVAKQKVRPEMRPLNVLVTAASRRVGLIRGFTRALTKLGNTGAVITTDISTLSPGLYFSNRHYIVPLTTHPDYIPIIKSICVSESISLLIPTIDDEIPVFGAHRDDFKRIGVKVACGSSETARTCNDKYATYLFLKDKGFPVAETYLPGKQLPRTFPLFIKPRVGRGSVGAYPVRNEKELRFFLDYIDDPVVQEFLTGREFTIDVCTDFEGRVLAVVPRERLVIRAGVSDRGITVKDPRLIDLGADVASALGIIGAANIQLKMDGERIGIFEVNPRYAGGIPLTIAAGADFPEWQIRLALGRKLEPRLGRFREGLTMACFEEALFIERNGMRMRETVDAPFAMNRVMDSFPVQ